ncbi:MAG: energy-coupled thiamine transporter ThiT [Oscillospiraceae bacterium]|nr:energy-coupled thiamine transporter ThiT [Oscillospiraceae bacterium]
MNNKINIKRLVETSLFIILGIILSMIRIFNLPYGGSITIASMLPLVFISFKYGTKWGIFAGIVYGLLSGIFGFSEGSFKGINFGMIFLIFFIDYILAHAVIGFSGLFRNYKKIKLSTRLVFGIIIGGSLKLFFHILSGAIFYGSYAQWFFSQEGFSQGEYILQKFSGFSLYLIYSLFYNISYMIPEIIITCIIGYALSKVSYINNKLKLD